MRLSVVVAEAALELVPSELLKTAAVRNDSERRGVEASRMLLDQSFHHSAMLKLKEQYKRGRPDLVHITLMNLVSTPMYLDGALKVYVHTWDDAILEIREGTRLPKSYIRFRGIMEKVLSGGGGEGLIKVQGGTVKDVLRTIRPDWVCGLSTQGAPMGLDELSAILMSRNNPCAIVGGFPHGHFSQETLQVMNRLVRIDPRPLEAHVVAARLVYEAEKRVRRDDSGGEKHSSPRPI